MKEGVPKENCSVDRAEAKSDQQRLDISTFFKNPKCKLHYYRSRTSAHTPGICWQWNESEIFF